MPKQHNTTHIKAIKVTKIPKILQKWNITKLHFGFRVLGGSCWRTRDMSATYGRTDAIHACSDRKCTRPAFSLVMTPKDIGQNGYIGWETRQEHPIFKRRSKMT